MHNRSVLIWCFRGYGVERFTFPRRFHVGLLLDDCSCFPRVFSGRPRPPQLALYGLHLLRCAIHEAAHSSLPAAVVKTRPMSSIHPATSAGSVRAGLVLLDLAQQQSLSALAWNRVLFSRSLGPSHGCISLTTMSRASRGIGLLFSEPGVWQFAPLVLCKRPSFAATSER